MKLTRPRADDAARRAGRAVRALAWLMTAALLAVSGATAQAQGPRHGPPPGGPSGPAADDEDAELQETIEIYMIARMKRSLSLSRDQEEAVVPLVQDLSDARRRFNRERRLSLMLLRPLAEDPAGSDEEIRKMLSHLDENERSFRSEEAKTLQQIRSVLTPRQQAQFICFQERFRAEMGRRLQRFRGMGPPGAERRRAGRQPEPSPGEDW